MDAGRYSVDGHDVGSGTVNVFLYAEDSKVDLAIASSSASSSKASCPKECGLAGPSTLTKSARIGNSNLSIRRALLSSILYIRRGRPHPNEACDHEDVVGLPFRRELRLGFKRERSELR